MTKALATVTPLTRPRFSWYSSEPYKLDQRWTVKNILPDTGTAILAAEWGFGKSFLAMELARCIMLGDPFAGHMIKRTGGVLWLAAEGEGEIEPRLEALRQDGRLPEDEPLPFAWTSRFPLLLADGAANELSVIVRQAREDMRGMFNVDLALIVVDTIAAVAGFKDENDAAECQRAMRVLSTMSDVGECLVLGIDHYGKSSESGVRGSSAKEASVDATMVITGTRDLKTNVVRDRVLVKRKLRAGVAGIVSDLDLKTVLVGTDDDGEAVTSAVVEWLGTANQVERRRGNALPAKAKLFIAALDDVLAVEGREVRPFGLDGPAVRAVAVTSLREQYLSRAPAAEKRETTRKRWNRYLEDLADRQAITVREVNGVELVWRT